MSKIKTNKDLVINALVAFVVITIINIGLTLATDGTNSVAIAMAGGDAFSITCGYVLALYIFAKHIKSYKGDEDE